MADSAKKETVCRLGLVGTFLFQLRSHLISPRRLYRSYARCVLLL